MSAHSTRSKRAGPAPNVRRLRSIAAALQYDREELSQAEAEQLAAEIHEAARWIEAAQPQEPGRRATLGTWRQAYMARWLVSWGHVAADDDAVACVVGADQGRDFERVARYLRHLRAGKRPKYVSVAMRDFEDVVSRLKRTHRIK